MDFRRALLALPSLIIALFLLSKAFDPSADLAPFVFGSAHLTPSAIDVAAPAVAIVLEGFFFLVFAMPFFNFGSYDDKKGTLLLIFDLIFKPKQEALAPKVPSEMEIMLSIIGVVFVLIVSPLAGFFFIAIDQLGSAGVYLAGLIIATGLARFVLTARRAYALNAAFPSEKARLDAEKEYFESANFMKDKIRYGLALLALLCAGLFTSALWPDKQFFTPYLILVLVAYEMLMAYGALKE